MAGSFLGGTCTESVLPRAPEMQMSMGTHFHIAPSELNTPTPNNGSNNFLIPAPNKGLLSTLRCEAEMMEDLSHSDRSQLQG